MLDNQTSTVFAESIFTHILDLVGSGENLNNDIEVNLILSEDGSIQNLNKRFLGKDKLTDVLSFPADLPFIPLLGDIIIDIKVADLQKGINSLKEEIQFLFLHGLLHLIGYDHLSASMAKEMEAKQNYYWKIIKR